MPHVWPSFASRRRSPLFWSGVKSLLGTFPSVHSAISLLAHYRKITSASITHSSKPHSILFLRIPLNDSSQLPCNPHPSVPSNSSRPLVLCILHYALASLPDIVLLSFFLLVSLLNCILVRYAHFFFLHHIPPSPFYALHVSSRNIASYFLSSFPSVIFLTFSPTLLFVPLFTTQFYILLRHSISHEQLDFPLFTRRCF